MSDLFQKDLYRYYGGRESLRRRLLRPLDLKYLYYFRKTSEAKNRLLYAYYKYRLRRLMDKTQIQIPAVTSIGEGLFIGHIGRIIINENARIGRNVNIAIVVTIG